MSARSALAIALLFSTCIAQAQVSLGIKAGIQHSSIITNNRTDNTSAIIEGSKVGFLAGGFARINISRAFCIQPDLLYTSRRGYLTGVADGDLSIQAAELSVNFMFCYEGFFMSAGPGLSYGLHAKYLPMGSQAKTDLYSQGNTDGKGLLRRAELGANGLMGYLFPGGLVVAANFSPGLTNIHNKPGRDIKVNTKMLGLSVGYLFGKKEK